MGSSAPKQRSSLHSFDIDNYLNFLIPRPRFYLLPKPISHFFGYRPPASDETLSKSAPPVSHLLVWAFAFIGGFCGIAIIENVFLALPLLGGHEAPIIIASFGAAAILEYNAIESPLAQPRNLVFGHFLSAIIGVAVTKLFLLLPEDRFEELRWLAGAIAVGAASSVMGITKTVHPPAGATALIAATSRDVTPLGWWLLPLVLLACTLMLVSAMIINNVYKRFPVYWWTPIDLTKKKGKDPIVKAKDLENGEKQSNVDSTSEAELPPSKDKQETTHQASTKNDPKALPTTLDTSQEHEIIIRSSQIVIPDWMNLSDWEKEVLETFQEKLRERTH